MSRFWSPIVHTLTPYTPGEQPKITNLIKLNTNENPYGPSPKAIDAMQAAVSDLLRLYPDPNGDALKDAVAHFHRADGITRANVFVGNSSDEVLAHTFQALLKHAAPLLFPDISYSFYPVYCGLYGIDYRCVPLNDAFAIDTNDYSGGGAMIFPNPNAPTGILLPLAQIEALLKAHPNQVVVVDEAYIDFGGTSAIALVNQYDNLLVVQTLSKSRSLAGLRVGFAVGHADLIAGLERVKNSFNSYPLDRVALAGAVAAIEDTGYFNQTCTAINTTRDTLTKSLIELGFEVLPSHANFVFVRHPHHDAAKLAQSLRERAILVRHFKQPRIAQFLRISIGSDAECAALITALQAILNT
ncbi:histidinol-phosphate transaminase [Deefgea salmonis]|uniref:Histidinol-phosphate aminotransferase n=1 Tax=Deefgea salmonis TaxID=2875502 RepID=A0ABS8BKX7_9NEIS|nr:histidinol-phosphate transaminase [Deefgea salmonis]MCB5196375.1 histidinol-phosphate transaminase [Deefgea salmonis]